MALLMTGAKSLQVKGKDCVTVVPGGGAVTVVTDEDCVTKNK